MGIQPFPGFRSLVTHHCVTGSMLHLFDFHRRPVTEDMLLGLGAIGLLSYLRRRR